VNFTARLEYPSHLESKHETTSKVRFVYRGVDRHLIIP
jgi:hypothetical protein